MNSELQILKDTIEQLEWRIEDMERDYIQLSITIEDVSRELSHAINELRNECSP